MTIEKFIKDILKVTFEKMFDLDKFKFNNIVITQETTDNIITFAKNAHPKEFVAFLDGKIVNKTLTINKLLYQHYHSTKNSASPVFHFPDKTFYGSVHSHPGYNNEPSSADKEFFRKLGIIHIIICKPYTVNTIKAYNQDGEEININIV
ncbi:MAG: Mov34/MPN/PAD-1 family protein [Candidatus Woesearchaeota archaeon]